MKEKLRKSGIDIIGNVPWGTHFCQFYQTKEDLMDILIPYFKAGLENNEFCMWVTSHPLSEEEAKLALEKVVPDIDRCLEQGQIEIIPYTDWYVKGGSFDSERVLNGWVGKLNQALKEGYDGLRLTGNTFWLEKEDWDNFVAYEEEVDSVIGEYQMMALCTYSLERCTAAEIIDVANNHEFALAKREGKWELLESSERKQTEKLKIASAYNRSLIEASVDPLVTIGPDGRITDVNNSTEAVTGHSRDELIGTDFSDYFIEPEKARSGYQQVFREGEVRDYPLEIQHKDGHITPVIYNASVYRDEDGKVIGVFAAARDIAERKKAEEEIQRLANVVESSDDAIITKSLEGDIISWNKGAEQIYGYSAHEVLGKNISTLSPPTLKEETHDLIEKIKHGERIHHYETSRIKKDGTIINISITLSPVFDTSGELLAISTIARDITASKKVEEELRLASIYNRSLIEANVDPLVTIGPDGKITDVNNSTEEITGFRREELIGKDFSDYFTEPDKAREGYEHVFREGFVRDYPLEIQHTSGRITPVLYNASVYRDEPGKVIGVFAAARDITKLKKAEKELRLVNKYNRSLIEASLDPLVTIGPDGKITDVNVSTETVTGHPRDELIGTDFSDYFTRPEEAQAGYKQVFQKGSVRDYPLEIKHKDGPITPVLYNASVYRDEDGKVIGVFAAARDITELKKAEEQLKLASAYNRSLIEASLDPLVTIGPDGGITDVNSATESVTGYSRDELIGTDFSDYFTNPDKAKEGYKRVFKEGMVLDYPLEIKHRDGHTTPVLYNASVYRDESGEVIGVFAAARDITELKKAEKMLKLKLEELARSNAELEQFAYVSSHDLQEPLRMITSYLQLLERKYQGEMDAKADKYIRFAVDGSTRMQTLINDLLAFSRVTTQAQEFKPTDCEFIYNQVLSNLEVSIKENEAIIAHDPLPTVMADDTQLAQVFQNLISNAIKFRSEEKPKIHISAEKENRHWLFSVQDNGIGIDPQQSERIFEVFKRLHKRREYPGTGIGLSISKKIIERHGGRIWVESERGEGSVFYFTLLIREDCKWKDKWELNL